MDGQKKQFIGICVLVVLCVAAYFGLKAYNEKAAEKEEQEADTEQIEAVSIDADSVKSFSYLLDGATVTFEKEDDTWYYKEDHSINIDQDAISTMLSAVAEVTATQKLEDVEDTSEYGFDSPTNVLTFEMEDGTRTITIGMQNEITSEYYIMDSNSDAVYIIETDLSSSFSKSVEDVTAEEEEETTDETTDDEESADAETTDAGTADEESADTETTDDGSTDEGTTTDETTDDGSTDEGTTNDETTD